MIDEYRLPLRSVTRINLPLGFSDNVTRKLFFSTSIMPVLSVTLSMGFLAGPGCAPVGGRYP